MKLQKLIDARSANQRIILVVQNAKVAKGRIANANVKSVWIWEM